MDPGGMGFFGSGSVKRCRSALIPRAVSSPLLGEAMGQLTNSARPGFTTGSKVIRRICSLLLLDLISGLTGGEGDQKDQVSVVASIARSR